MIFNWSIEKNELLKKQRGVCFEDVEQYLSHSPPLDVRPHPNNKKYPHQKLFIIELKGYPYMIPFIEEKDIIFLKTIIPNRKLKKEFL